MHLKVAQNRIGVAARIPDLVQHDAGAVKRGAEGHVVLERVVDVFRRELADDAFAAKQRLPGAFLVGEVDRLQVTALLEFGFLDAAQALQRDQNANGAIVTTAVGNGVQMRPDHEGLGLRVIGAEPAAQIANFVIAHLQARFLRRGRRTRNALPGPRWIMPDAIRRRRPWRRSRTTVSKSRRSRSLLMRSVG